MRTKAPDAEVLKRRVLHFSSSPSTFSVHILIEYLRSSFTKLCLVLVAKSIGAVATDIVHVAQHVSSRNAAYSHTNNLFGDRTGSQTSFIKKHDVSYK